MSDTEKRLIDGNELKRIAYQRFGLSAIKLITLVDEMPSIETKESDNGRTHTTRFED